MRIVDVVEEARLTARAIARFSGNVFNPTLRLGVTGCRAPERPPRLHRDVKQSMLLRVVGAGHMVYQTATVHVMEAIEAAMPSPVSEQGTDGAIDQRGSAPGEVAAKIGSKRAGVLAG